MKKDTKQQLQGLADLITVHQIRNQGDHYGFNNPVSALIVATLHQLQNIYSKNDEQILAFAKNMGNLSINDLQGFKALVENTRAEIGDRKSSHASGALSFMKMQTFESVLKNLEGNLDIEIAKLPQPNQPS